MFLLLLNASFNAHSGMWDQMFAGKTEGIYTQKIADEIKTRSGGGSFRLTARTAPVPSTICQLDASEEAAYTEITNRVSNFNTNNADKEEAFFHLLVMYGKFLNTVLEYERAIQDGAFKVEREKQAIADQLAVQIGGNVQVVKGYVSKIEELIEASCRHYPLEYGNSMYKYGALSLGEQSAAYSAPFGSQDASTSVVIVREEHEPIKGRPTGNSLPASSNKTKQ